MVTVLIKMDLLQEDILAVIRQMLNIFYSPFDHTTIAVSDCLEGITCSFLCDNSFHIKIPHVTNAI